MDEATLPLFPLNVVLFPGSALPLHIFEERYKVLIGKCIEVKGMEFGINFVDVDKMSLVGCTAQVHEVTKRYEDGQLDIVVEGGRRFEIQAIEENAAPYNVGTVLFFGDVSEETNPRLVDETLTLYHQLVEVVYKGRLPQLFIESAGPDVSFVIARKAGMDLQQRQRLLEMRSENRRLKLLRSYLSAVIPRLQHSEEIQRVINSDGYIMN